MKKTALALSSCVLLVACESTPTIKDGKPGTWPAGLEQEEVMERMIETATPGLEHAKLADMVGDWDVAVRYRWRAHNTWQTGTGTSKIKSVLDGRYVVEEINLDTGDVPYHGFQIYGFDNIEKRYFQIWMDSLSTWPTATWGDWDAKDDKGTLVLSGRIKDIISPEGRPFRQTRRWDGKDKLITQIYDTIGGTEKLVLEMVKTRRKSQTQ